LKESEEQHAARVRLAAVESEGELVQVGLQMVALDRALMGPERPALDESGHVMDARQRDVSRRQEELRRLELEHAERERLKRIEKARASRLSTEISAWRLAVAAREYVSALRARLPELSGDDRTRVEAWCEWIDEWGRRSDPALNVGLIRGLDDEHDQHHYPR